MSEHGRFWEKVDASGDCWLWLASKRSGYGQFWVKAEGRAVPAHRFSWELVNGPLRDGLEIHHECFNPSCVNPDHLRPVTPIQNKRLKNPARAPGRPGRSGVKGVTWVGNIRKWKIRREGRSVYFAELDEAVAAMHDKTVSH